MRYREICEDVDDNAAIEEYKKAIVVFLRNRAANHVYRVPAAHILDKTSEFVTNRGINVLSLDKSTRFTMLNDALTQLIDAGMVATTGQVGGMWTYYSLGPKDEFLAGHKEKHADVVRLIREECKTACATYQKTGLRLYRGVSPDRGTFIQGKPREDRQPRDMPPSIHRAIDETMKEMGFAAVRSNSLFATSDENEASSYGTVYVIFPTDGFDFTYFQDAKDLFTKANDFLKDFKMTPFPSHDDGSPSPESVEFFMGHLPAFVKGCMPSNQSFEEALESRHEVMLANCFYYGIRYDFFEVLEDHILT